MLTSGRKAKGGAPRTRAMPAALQGLNPPLANGITHGKVVPGGAAYVRSQEEITAVKCIVLREELARHLRELARRLEDRFEVSPQLADCFANLRQATVDACEHIMTWKRSNENKPFLFNGENYLLRLSASMDFLDRSTPMIKWFGFHLTRNPFLVPSRGTPDDMLPPESVDNMASVDMLLLRELEEKIVVEEREYGILPATEQCSWCGIETTKHTRAMCRPCREFYCYTCVECNLGAVGEAEARKSTAWVCFVCTWDERQRLARDALKEARRVANKPLYEARQRAAIARKLAERANKFGHQEVNVATLADSIPLRVRKKAAPPPKPKKAKKVKEPKPVKPVVIAPDLPPRQFVMGFNISRPLSRDTARKLKDIALRLHRPRSVWWAFMDSGEEEAPDWDGDWDAPLPDFPRPRSAAARSGVDPFQALSRRLPALSRQEALVELCVVAKEPREEWQGCVLRRVPYLDLAAQWYRRGGLWEWTRDRRRRRRQLLLRLHVEAHRGNASGLLKDSNRPWEERKRTRVDIVGGGDCRFSVERRMGVKCDQQVLLTATFHEDADVLPEYMHAVDACSVTAMEDGEAGPLHQGFATQLHKKGVREGQRRHLQAQVDADPDEYDSDVDIEAIIEEAENAEVPADVQDIVTELLNHVAPPSEADVVVMHAVDYIVDKTIALSYEFDSEQVANAMMDYLIDRATSGHYRGSQAVWRVNVADLRTREEWALSVPAHVIKTEAAALAAMYGGADAEPDPEPFWWAEAKEAARMAAEQAARDAARASPRKPETPPAPASPHAAVAAKAASEADKAKTRIAEARARAAAAREAALNRYGASSDSGSDSDSDSSSVSSDDSDAQDPAATEAATDVVDALVGSVAALSEARHAGRAIFSDVMRQFEVLMDRVALVPSTFPLSAGAQPDIVAPAQCASPFARESLFSEPSWEDDMPLPQAPVPLELRLGLSITEQRAMLRAWESPREAAALSAMRAAEAEARAFETALAAERGREAAERAAMAAADEEGQLLRGATC